MRTRMYTRNVRVMDLFVLSTLCPRETTKTIKVIVACLRILIRRGIIRTHSASKIQFYAYIVTPIRNANSVAV